MSEKDEDIDFELIDDDEVIVDGDDEDGDEDIDNSDDKSKKVDGDDTTPAKKKGKNSSNWKKVTKTNKALMAENEKLKKQLAGNNDDDDGDDEDDEDKSFVNPTDLRLFVIENPEAKELQNEISKIIEESKGTFTYERAFKLAQAEKPEESGDEDDFGTRSSNSKPKKRLADLTPEEALKLPNDKFLAYQRLKGKIK